MNCEKKHIGYTVGINYQSTEQLLNISGKWCKYNEHPKVFETEVEAGKFINKYKSLHSEDLYSRKFYELIYRK